MLEKLETFEYRDYQVEVVNKIFQAWSEGDLALMLQLPTASGKTWIFVNIAVSLLSQQQPVIIVAHQKELIDQAVAKLNQLINLPIGVIKAGVKPNPNALIQIASIQSLIRRQLPPASLLIIDEAHHSYPQSYAKIIDHYRRSGAYILGVTGTPCRTDGRGFRVLKGGVSGYDKLICGPSVKKLTERGYLAPFKLYAAKNIVDARGSKIKISGGDYDLRELTELVESKLVIGEVIDTWLELAQGLRTVIFAVSTNHSKDIATEFCRRGISAAHIDAKTSVKERERIFKEFAAGDILVITQYSIVTEGVDIAGIQVIQNLRPTNSIVRWFQSIGRALRTESGKSEAIVIDHTDTYLNLPWPIDEVKWSLDGKPAVRERTHTAHCPSCQFSFRISDEVFRSRIAICPNCDTYFVFTTKKIRNKQQRIEVIETVDAQFVLIKRLSSQLFSLLEGRLNDVLQDFIEQQILPYVKPSQHQEFLDYIVSYSNNGLLYKSITQLHSIERVDGYFPSIPPAYVPPTPTEVAAPKTRSRCGLTVQASNYCDTFLNILSKVPDEIFDKYGAFDTFEIDFRQKFGIYKYLNYGSFLTKLQIFFHEAEGRSSIRYGEQVLVVNQGILKDISLLSIDTLPESVIRQIFVYEGWEFSTYMNHEDLFYKLYNIVEGRQYSSVSKWQIELKDFLSKKQFVNPDLQHHVGEAIEIKSLPYFSCNDFLRLKQDYFNSDLFDEFSDLVDTIASRLELNVDNLSQHSKYPEGLLELVYQDFADV